MGKLRRVALVLSGLAVILIALVAIPFPNRVAEYYGLTLGTPSSFNEFRAVFIGFWIGQGTTMRVAARSTDVPLLGNLCALLILAAS